MLKANLRYIRERLGVTQKAIAEKYFVSRQAWASYEEGRAEPKLLLLRKLAIDSGYSIDQLVNMDIATGKDSVDSKGTNLRLLTVAVDANNQEVISVVPHKAAAGYANGYSDTEYIANLGQVALKLPELKGAGSRRLFQIKGDSMLPVPSGAYVISHYVQNWEELKEGNCYVIVTREDGILYKRLINRAQHDVDLQSDNPAFKEIKIAFSEVLEIWKADGYINLSLPGPGEYVPGLLEIKTEIQQLRREISNSST